MAVVEINTHRDGSRVILFWCPGCGEPHGVPFEGARSNWTFDGNVEAPTLSPSLLVRHGDERRCHLFVRAGKLQFLGDSTHHLAGQTVEMETLCPEILE